jgi:pyrimidine operon attenuation protein / uracil phosphoribosyltransferase
VARWRRCCWRRATPACDPTTIGAGFSLALALTFLHAYHAAFMSSRAPEPLFEIHQKAQLMSASEVERTLIRLAHEILERNNGVEDLALIGIRRRGVPLAERLAKIIQRIEKQPVPLGTLDITLYRDDLSLRDRTLPDRTLNDRTLPDRILNDRTLRDGTLGDYVAGSSPVVRKSEPGIPIEAKSVVLVDDVLYTGRTTRAAMDALFRSARPKRLQLCVLIDRGHRELPIEAAFVGRKVQTTENQIIEVKLREIDDAEKVLLMEKQQGNL